ncbi:HK97 family phage prohead protease [Sphingomonas sp. LB-2]|uniref:HK97 family phage prohead protease n=1 Tax=Sphingomonas caeni TaxID=2984949 RepID=UPI002232459F|nr:HK97 family phage prohead protease [Sphingomonas caeni]MCW3846428.1 HK97 family phage prohead protease [Sphingomonas caeni]
MADPELLSPEGRGSVRFAGYAAVFDAPDRGGDVVRRGAFRVRGGVPLLWQHGGEPVGAIERIEEDSRGLRVIGSVTEPRLAAAVASGAVNGLSFGYRVREAARNRWRELLQVELQEVSLVASPMQPLARVHAVTEAGLAECAAAG